MTNKQNKFKDLLQELARGYFAGEDANEEVKEAWIMGFRYGLKTGLSIKDEEE